MSGSVTGIGGSRRSSSNSSRGGGGGAAGDGGCCGSGCGCFVAVVLKLAKRGIASPQEEHPPAACE